MAMAYEHSLVWLRRDLRLEDNTALSEAGKVSNKVAVVFVFDSQILNRLKNKSDARVSFIFESLKEINSLLEKQGSQLIVRYGNPVEEIPKLLKKMNFDALFLNEDYEIYAKLRDKKIENSLRKCDIKVHAFKDHVIFSGSQVHKPDGKPYQMFTPYKKAWLKKLRRNDFEPRKTKCSYLDKKSLLKHSEKLSLTKAGFSLVEQYFPFQQPGRNAGLRALKSFSKAIESYDKNRDFPYLEGGTSGLSVHLRFGTISVRECVWASMQCRNKGAQTWLSELIWRDFYSMILDQYPHVERGCFKKQYGKIKWPKTPKYFKAWREGKTGFPIVDAGMRQLNETGWMHNRVRMIVASFLVKDLLIDWRKGEAYFAEKLLDFDLASNNGGWQWSASTGCDAQPFFRIFNPSLQSKRFDPDSIYIKRWVPELQDCSAKDIHNPEKSELYNKAKYPEPILSHSMQKVKAVRLFKNI